MMSSKEPYADLLSPRLSRLLDELPPSIYLDCLSRLPASRIRETALSQISSIELVSSVDFANHYDSLYVSMFPKRTERERSDLIISRLAADEHGERNGLAPYRIVGIRDKHEKPIAAAQFSVLPIKNARPMHGAHISTLVGSEPQPTETARVVVPYLQYIYVHPSYRRQDISEVLHTMVLAVANADATGLVTTSDTVPEVPFTLFETEPSGPIHSQNLNVNQGKTSEPVLHIHAHERSKIHTASGGVALVLRRNSSPSRFLSPHVQPGLEPLDPPLTLLWMIRSSPNLQQAYDVRAIGKDLIAAYYQSLRDEGFPEDNIRLAEQIVEQRYADTTFEIMSLGDIEAVDSTTGDILLATTDVHE